jgi:fibrillarin-like rRNA methylase
MKYSTDLSGVVVGDVLAIKLKNASCYSNSHNWVLCKVDHITQTQIILVNGKKFNKNDGKEVTSGSFKYQAVIASPELVKDIMEKQQLKFEIRTKVDIDSLQLQKILDILG